MAVSVKEDCWDPEILLLWWRDVTLILSKNKFYSQSQHDAEPVEDRRMLHVTWPGVNCIIQVLQINVIDWTLLVILLTSAMFKLDEVCGKVVFSINPSLSSFSTLFNFTGTGEGLVEMSSSFEQIFRSFFLSAWPFSKMDLSICGDNLCCSVMSLISGRASMTTLSHVLLQFLCVESKRYWFEIICWSFSNIDKYLRCFSHRTLRRRLGRWTRSANRVCPRSMVNWKNLFSWIALGWGNIISIGIICTVTCNI